MQQVNLKDLSLEGLKILAYDTRKDMETLQSNLRLVEQEIAYRISEAKKHEPQKAD